MHAPVDVLELDLSRPQDREALAAFYDRCGYRGKVADGDRVLVAVSGCAIAGAVRACEEEGHLVLRGMYVCPKRRGEGIGARLLAAWTERFGGREALCLPLAHLERFYGTAGFTAAGAETLPPHLLLRLEGYRARGLTTIAMRRAGA